jgi:cytoskeleton protein RodZ
MNEESGGELAAGAVRSAPSVEAGASAGSAGSVGPCGVIGSLAELVQAREQRGFAVSLVSSRLRLAPRQIIALESGDWASLPGRSFIRASLRSYGKLVDVDVEPLLVSIEPSLPGGEVLKPDSELRRPMPRAGALGFGGSGSGSRWVWTLLIVVGIVALAFFYGGGASFLVRDGSLSSRGQPGVPGASPPSARTESVEKSAPAGSPAGIQPDARPGRTPEAGEGTNPAGGFAAAAAPSAGSASAAVSAPVPGPVAGAVQGAAQAVPAPQAPAASALPLLAPAGQGAAPAGLVGATATGTQGAPLVLRFAGESWIEIRDAAGNILAIGTQPPGTVREFSAEPPYSLTIGNAVAASVSVRGTPVDLAPHMRQGVARFRIE